MLIILICLDVCNSFSDEKEVDLSLTDWLDGLQKTVKNSIQQHRDKESQGITTLFGLLTALQL